MRENGRVSVDKYWRFKSSQETDVEGESVVRSKEKSFEEKRGERR